METDKMTDKTPSPEAPYTSGPFAGLTPNVMRLGLVSFFVDVSSEMLYPLIPIFLTAVLGATMPVVGLIEGVAEATASLLKTVSGRLSDLSGRRRPFVFAGYAISALSKPLIGLAYGWPLVLTARVADRFGKGLRTSPRDALLADSVAPEFRGRAYGWHRAMDTLGAVLGPLLGLMLLFLMHGKMREIFIVALIPGAIGALLVLLVREKLRAPGAAKPPVASIRFGALPPAFRGYLIAWGAFALANSSDVFIILRAGNILGVHPGSTQIEYSTARVILLYTFYNLIYALASPALGNLSDRLGRKRILVGGLLVFAAVYAGFALASQLWHLVALFAVYGLYMAATDGVGKALAVDLVTPDIRASAIGLLGTVSGVATLFASIVAGLLWKQFGPWAAFAYGSLGAVFGAMLIARLKVPQRQ